MEDAKPDNSPRTRWADAIHTLHDAGFTVDEIATVFGPSRRRSRGSIGRCIFGKDWLSPAEQFAAEIGAGSDTVISRALVNRNIRNREALAKAIRSGRFKYEQGIGPKRLMVIESLLPDWRDICAALDANMDDEERLLRALMYQT